MIEIRHVIRQWMIGPATRKKICDQAAYIEELEKSQAAWRHAFTSGQLVPPRTEQSERIFSGEFVRVR